VKLLQPLAFTASFDTIEYRGRKAIEYRGRKAIQCRSSEAIEDRSRGAIEDRGSEGNSNPFFDLTFPIATL
jgi:hypothetical protein